MHLQQLQLQESPLQPRLQILAVVAKEIALFAEHVLMQVEPTAIQEQLSGQNEPFWKILQRSANAPEPE